MNPIGCGLCLSCLTRRATPLDYPTPDGSIRPVASLAVRADVSNLTDLDTMFATIKREFGHLDGIFVNAGYSEFQLFEEVTEQSFDKVIAVNFKGAYFTIQKALPLLRQG